MNTRSFFHNMFDSFLDSLGMDDKAENFDLIDRKKKSVEKVQRERVASIPQKRSTSWGRIYDQVRTALYALDDWSYPLDLYMDDAGSSMFTIVAQSGKLYQVPLTLDKDTVTLGEWTQVKEEFAPVEQSFRVMRQKDGKYRWTSIAATSVLNRVGEIDSTALFDSFIEHSEDTGEYPRLDFYHKGSENLEIWEFGTADFLAREGVCYIASGLFDEDHPLAKAAISACSDDSHAWGNSIEFYALAEREMILIDPKIEVPMYTKGKNTRISLVLEEDAAGLFTRLDVNQGVERTMDKKTTEKLTALFGGESDELQAFLRQFEDGVDEINRTVKDESLIHRAKDEVEGSATVEGELVVSETEVDEFELDDETITIIAEQVSQSNAFKEMQAGISEIRKLVAGLVVERENDKKEITRLNEEVVKLGKDEDEKKSEYLQDLPTRKRTHITHRPRETHDVDGVVDMKSRAEQTLNGIPASSRY